MPGSSTRLDGAARNKTSIDFDSSLERFFSSLHELTVWFRIFLDTRLCGDGAFLGVFPVIPAKADMAL